MSRLVRSSRIRWVRLVLVLGAVLLGMLVALAPAATMYAEKPDHAGKPRGGGGDSWSPVARRVCLDAGHGGTDPGAVNTAYGLQEKGLTLDIAYRLKGLLENAGAGFSVVMTRTGDETLGNTERANRCNDGLAEVVLSIHLNAASDPAINYFQAFYGKKTKDEAFTQTIWNAYALTKPNGTEPLPKQPITNFASGLLLKSNGPACLAETVFLTNTAEAALLADGTGARQQAIAEQLFKGLKAWYGL